MTNTRILLWEEILPWGSCKTLSLVVARTPSCSPSLAWLCLLAGHPPTGKPSHQGTPHPCHQGSQLLCRGGGGSSQASPEGLCPRQGLRLQFTCAPEHQPLRSRDPVPRLRRAFTGCERMTSPFAWVSSRRNGVSQVDQEHEVSLAFCNPQGPGSATPTLCRPQRLS